MQGLLILEDGTTLTAKYTGIEKNVFGEIVFNTSMTGYEEAFTDPSYAGQILLMTYPLIGNYGFSKYNRESSGVHIRGLVLKEPYFSQHRGKRFSTFLDEARIPCLYGVDTRFLTLKIRKHGTMRAMIIPGKKTARAKNEFLIALKKRPYPDTENLVRTVSCKKITIHKGRPNKKIVLIDCGVKSSIINNLKKFATVVQVPFNTKANAIKNLRPDGIVLSNGPGNPAHPALYRATIQTVKSLINKYPLFGICLGHQILGIALGFKTYKLKFGHRGSNHAVKDLTTNKLYITSQNHGYALDMKHNHNAEITWINVNDKTVEGLRHKTLPVFSVQFHPEASPGPYDTLFIFRKFIEML
jgi:carbamoyl-phosphate synthase small subunit